MATDDYQMSDTGSFLCNNNNNYVVVIILQCHGNR